MRCALVLIGLASMTTVAEERKAPARPAPQKVAPAKPADKAKAGEANPRPWCGKDAPKKAAEAPKTAPAQK